MTEERIDYYNQPIGVNDAASMLRSRVSSNERPYTQAVLKLNNKLVDEWKASVLDKISDRRGTIPSGRVWSSWQVFFEGKGISKYRELKDQEMIFTPTEEQVAFWKEFFENLSVEEMHAYGVGSVAFGWRVIEEHFRMWSADLKWENIYSKSEDPLDWEKLSYGHSNLMNGKMFPFWEEDQLNEIKQKVFTVLSVQVKVQ